MRAAREDMPRKRLKRPGPCDARRARRPGSVRRTRAGDRGIQVERSEACLVSTTTSRDARATRPVLRPDMSADESGACRRRRRRPIGRRDRDWMRARHERARRRHGRPPRARHNRREMRAGQTASGPVPGRTSPRGRAWHGWGRGPRRTLVGTGRPGPPAAQGKHRVLIRRHRHPVVGSENPRRTSRLPRQHSPRCSSLR